MPVIDERQFLLKTLLARITRIETAAKEVESAPTTKNRTLLKAMAERLDDQYAQFLATIDKIVSYNAKNGIEADLSDEIIKFEAPYFYIKSIMNIAWPSAPRRSDSGHSGTLQGNESTNFGVQLPKIKLAEFDGDVKAWTGFAELFNETVDSNEHLSDVQKHMYLRSALKGEALSLVSSLPLTGPNYRVCWNSLKTRFDNLRLQTSAHLESLFTLPSTHQNANSIRNFSCQITEATGALTALGHDVEGWAVPIIFMCAKKLHAKLREEWERRVVVVSDPSIKEFTWFLHEQARILEAAHSAIEPSSKRASPRVPNKSSTMLMVNASESQICGPKCSNPHVLDQCGRFRQESVENRWAFAREEHLCLACLNSDNHYASACGKSKPCKYCDSRHHSLLHAKTGKQLAGPSTTNPPPHQPFTPVGSSHGVTSMQIYSSRKQGQVLLATAVANIKDGRGHTQGVRLLIDPASQATFLTKACAQRLGLQARPVNVPVLGMGHVSLGICRQMVRCNFQPVNEVELQVDAMVVDHITRAPSKWVPALPPERVQGVHLADPNYNEPAAVDLLLGAEWFGCVILEKPIQGPPGTPSLLKTIWGYCVVGRHQRTTAAVQSLCLATDEETPPLDHIIRRFWEIEEPPLMFTLSPEDQACKELYNATVARQVSGKYVVTLPFKPDYHPLGDSRQGALSRFLALEKRLRLNPTLASLYKEFMSDYLKQGHMKLAGSREIPFSGYYIPHHCIFREDEDGSISKFRVVFNASMATRDGPSLNQVLYKGPKLQKDIVVILLRVRMFEVVLSADVRQMYRNILLTNSQLNFQRIFWRPSPEEPIREYVLTTVTYGVAPAPYLAIETMNQLVKDEGEPFPLASEALTEDTYVDDVIKSVPSVETAIKLKEELQQLLRKGGFELRKWMSNREEVLHLLPVEHCAVPAESLSFEKDEPSAKILGLVWAPRSDLFTYKILEAPATATKRLIMSDIGKLFDPVGFVSPVVFIAKCLIRELWQRGIDWDQQPPEEICSKWMRFRTELKELERFSLPRWVHLHERQTFELHGFSDSSEQGYAGVVYLRTVLPNGEVKVSLLMAKSKVARVKEHSLPRLELCGIELVTRLLDHIVGVFRPFGQPEITVWSDSTVALYWVKSPPHKWKTFVANRVSSCQRRIAPDRYRHVPTKLNPADCASRGMFPKDFVDHDLWKYGPPFLQQSEEYWPRLHLTTSTAAEEDCEARLVCQVTLGTGPEEAVDTHCELIQRFSNLAKLQRVTAWVLRFWHNRVVHRTKGIPKRSGPLQLQELNYALAACCRAVQREEFQEDLKALQKGKPGTKLLRNLAPFLDEKGLIRVGGRLRHSGLPYDQKYPVILPRSHPFTNLIIDHYHRSFLHPGLSNLHSIIHRHFWILSARSAISNQVAKCHRCFRTDPRSLEPKMGDLPHDRVNPGKPFQSTGVDYGGPFQIKMSRLRNAKISKAYICLFVCFTTKAVHLELASDLSTEAFLAALRRFVARRGAVSIMYSDGGTNFIGARNQLEGWKQIVQSPDFNDEAARYLAQRNIEWKLNPPASPHFGGLWESGIKSTKRLLARVIGSQLLTFEEFYTVLVQVEATLNSRPLVPLTADPEDLDVLTPGHFLMMEPPGALFERPPPPAEMTVRDRWTLLQQLVASYWKKWSNDYLNTLQRRGKWSKSKPDLKQGMMVLVKELSSPPLHWKIGRVMQTYPGSDGISRVADVKTVTGTYRRSAVNLCPLPDQ